MLPLIARASAGGAAARARRSLRDAADALGVSRWRTVLGVVLPSALGGIVTGTVLAVARAAGETAPAAASLTSIVATSVTTLNIVRPGAAEHPRVDLHRSPRTPTPPARTRAWGAALVLLGVHPDRERRARGRSSRRSRGS